MRYWFFDINPFQHFKNRETNSNKILAFFLEDFSQSFIGRLNHLKCGLPTFLLLQVHLGMLDQTSYNLLEVFFLARISVPFTKLDS